MFKQLRRRFYGHWQRLQYGNRYELERAGFNFVVSRLSKTCKVY